jgi:hypothetical protein
MQSKVACLSACHKTRRREIEAAGVQEEIVVNLSRTSEHIASNLYAPAASFTAFDVVLVAEAPWTRSLSEHTRLSTGLRMRVCFRDANAIERMLPQSWITY